MKRLGIVMGSAFASVLLFASQALASSQYPPSKPPTTVPPEPTVPTLPFTGANISLGIVLVAVLVVAGAVLLFVARRRARASL